jgi:hypothetical protein
MTPALHTIVIVVGIAAAVVLAVTRVIAPDVAVATLTTFVGYGIGAGVQTVTAKSKP